MLAVNVSQLTVDVTACVVRDAGLASCHDNRRNEFIKRADIKLYRQFAELLMFLLLSHGPSGDSELKPAGETGLPVPISVIQ